MDDVQLKDRDRLIRTLDAGYLVRWDQHDPESLEEEVGPIVRSRAGEQVRDLEQAWFD